MPFENFVLLTVLGLRTNPSDSDGPGGEGFIRQWIAEQVMSRAGMIGGCSLL